MKWLQSLDGLTPFDNIRIVRMAEIGIESAQICSKTHSGYDRREMLKNQAIILRVSILVVHVATPLS